MRSFVEDVKKQNMITACKTEAVSREGVFPPCSLPGTGRDQTVAGFPPCYLQDTGRDQTVAVFPPCSLQDTGRDQTVAVSAGESVAQSKSTRSPKPELSTMERGHQMEGWPLRPRLCARPQISPESNSVQSLQKSFG